MMIIAWRIRCDARWSVMQQGEAKLRAFQQAVT